MAKAEEKKNNDVPLDEDGHTVRKFVIMSCHAAQNIHNPVGGGAGKEANMKRHALFAGVNNYTDKSIRRLRYSIPDASVLADRFKGLGYKTRLLSDPTEAELKNAISESVDGLGRGDVFLFFFAGHGFTAQDGTHLLFCHDSIQKLIRVNDGGVKVNTLEALTDKTLTDQGGFHRAFLLDSCRTDCFAGMEGRGGTTRDLDFVTMPECTRETGSFFLLRSCDKFCPSLEFDSIGHGLFTQGLLDAMDARDGRLASCDTSFAEAVGAKMADIQIENNVPTPQRPSIGECSGPVFSLFDDGFLIPTAESTPPVSPIMAPDPCPECGMYNEITNTFKCKVCGRDHLCKEHYSKDGKCCTDCAAKAQARRAADEKARREAGENVRLVTLPKTGDVKTLILPGGAEMEMIYCPPGEFMMGSPTTEEARYDDEVLHRVKLTKGFWLGKYPVTQQQWVSVMGKNPSCFKGDDLPVEQVSWEDCQAFVEKVNVALGCGARLPTEAEWEYACRAGTTTPYCWGDMLNGDRANCDGKFPCGTIRKGPYLARTTPVGKYGANAWGGCDMHGNVWEWCSDWHGTYPSGCVTDPQGPVSGTDRVVRGGSWSHFARNCRSAFRLGNVPGTREFNVGFRLACST